MKAREFFAASGRSDSDTLRIADLIGYEEAQGNPAPDLKAERTETKVASAEDIERVRRGDHLTTGAEGGGATAHRDAGESSTKKKKR